MPHIDGRSGEVVIRIVYDGAPEAGKTTNVQQLSHLVSLQRRGASKSPGTSGDRTEFFDWLDFSGGYLDGRRVRCQLVSVPGQSRLLHRRKYLLETADAIVYVADSRREHLEDAARNLSATIRIVERVARGVPVGVVLQANKQDLAGALAPAEVAVALGAAAATPVVAGVASSGDGVMQTFVVAVRLATDRVRALIVGDVLGDLPLVDETPEGLHAAMVEIDSAHVARIEAERAEAERAEAARIEAERAEAARIEAERVEAERAEAARVEAERAEAARIEAERAEAARIEADRAEAARIEAERAAESSFPSEMPTPEEVVVEFDIEVSESPVSSFIHEPGPVERKNIVAGAADVVLPQAHEIASGHVWPPVKGRAALAMATSGQILAPATVQPWAPIGAIEIVSDSGWVLHSTERWVFDSEPLARVHLLTMVRRLLPRADLLPESRSLVLARDDARWRLWLVTPRVPSLRDSALAAIADADIGALAGVLERAAYAVDKLGEHGLRGAPLPAGAGALGLHDGRLVLLALDEGVDQPAPEAHEPLADLGALTERLTRNHTALHRWFEQHGSQILAAITERRAQQ